MGTFKGETFDAWEELYRRNVKVRALRSRISNRFVSKAFLIPKAKNNSQTGQWKLIVDRRSLSVLLYNVRFKFSSLKDLTHRRERYSFMLSLQLADAYFHLEVAEQDVDYLKINVNNKLSSFISLLFRSKGRFLIGEKNNRRSLS